MSNKEISFKRGKNTKKPLVMLYSTIDLDFINYYK